MRKAVRFIKTKTGLLAIIVAATVVGGVMSAVVSAAIPDSGGTIHGCYRNSAGLFDSKGTLRVINSDNGETCTGSETGLTWSQGGVSPTIHDANGQTIGDFIAYTSQGFTPGIQVYNHTLNRIVPIVMASDQSYVYGSTTVPVVFQSTDCSGTPYTIDNSNGFVVKTMLVKRGNASYAVVQNSTQPQSLTYSSQLSYSPGSNSYTCNNTGPSTNDAYLLTSVSSPFTNPLAGPFRF
jgi:hypothetical protein